MREVRSFYFWSLSDLQSISIIEYELFRILHDKSGLFEAVKCHVVQLTKNVMT